MSDTDAAAAPAPRKTAAPRTREAKNPRGRPKAAAPETPQQRIDRLKAELQQAEEAKKIAEAKRDSIVGKVLVAHALTNADFRRQIAAILKAEIKGKGELVAIAELLG